MQLIQVTDEILNFHMVIFHLLFFQPFSLQVIIFTSDGRNSKFDTIIRSKSWLFTWPISASITSPSTSRSNATSNADKTVHDKYFFFKVVHNRWHCERKFPYLASTARCRCRSNGAHAQTTSRHSVLIHRLTNKRRMGETSTKYQS